MRMPLAARPEQAANRKCPKESSSGVVVRSTGAYEKLSGKRHHPGGKGVTCVWTLILGQVSDRPQKQTNKKKTPPLQPSHMHAISPPRGK